MATFQAFTLQNSNGCQVRFTNYGGKVMSIVVPDKEGQPGDIVLGYSQPEQYAYGNPYFGALIGRYANRIAFGKFMLGTREYQLPVNNRTNCLHGGP
ncbi:MAG: galactose-1-epimerase, partial [Bacteroidota bacterium]